VTEPADLPLPDIDDPDATPFWSATRKSRLVMQRCPKCGELRWPPAPICPECLAVGGHWTELSGKGTVWSYAVYHRAFHPGFASKVPYTIVLVELDEGPRMISSLPDGVPACNIGDRVKAEFVGVTPEVTLVKFRPVE
jgi:uncharacterized OB-fold protein